MGFRSNDRGFSRRDRGRGSFRGNRGERRRDSGRFSRGDREMFDVVCDKCGKNCQVPFKPSNDKPVLCSECFEKKQGPRGNFESFSKSSSSQGISQEQFQQLNKKLDKILEILEDVEIESDSDEDSEEDEN